MSVLPLASRRQHHRAADYLRRAVDHEGEVLEVYGNASIVGNDRVVFNIGGNRFRLVVRFDYVHRIGFVRFVGTHSEYDAIDASDV